MVVPKNNRIFVSCPLLIEGLGKVGCMPTQSYFVRIERAGTDKACKVVTKCTHYRLPLV